MRTFNLLSVVIAGLVFSVSTDALVVKRNHHGIELDSQRNSLEVAPGNTKTNEEVALQNKKRWILGHVLNSFTPEEAEALAQNPELAPSEGGLKAILGGII